MKGVNEVQSVSHRFMSRDFRESKRKANIAHHGCTPPSATFISSSSRTCETAIRFRI